MSRRRTKLCGGPFQVVQTPGLVGATLVVALDTGLKCDVKLGCVRPIDLFDK